MVIIVVAVARSLLARELGGLVVMVVMVAMVVRYQLVRWSVSWAGS